MVRIVRKLPCSQASRNMFTLTSSIANLAICFIVDNVTIGTIHGAAEPGANDTRVIQSSFFSEANSNPKLTTLILLLKA